MSEWDHGFWAEVEAQRAYRVACQESDWTHLGATHTAPPVRRCPWCGSQDIAAEVVGAFASFTCPVHGCVTWLTEESVWINESKPLLDVVLCCPHCGPPEIPGQEQEEAGPEAACRGRGSVDCAVFPARPADGWRSGARRLGLIGCQVLRDTLQRGPEPGWGPDADGLGG